MERDVTAALREVKGATKQEVLTFETYVSQALAADRLIGTLIGACGVIALGLGVVGVYGVMIDAVRRRRREFGLRAALGASPADLVRALLGTSAAAASGGIACGLGGAFVLSRVVRSMVFGLPPIDGGLVAAIIVLMTLVVVAAVAGPARQAVRVSPLVALRDQS